MNVSKILGLIFGNKQDKDIRKLKPILEKVNSFRESISKLSDDELKGKTEEFRDRIKNGEELDQLLPEAFAVVREATHRVLGEGRIVEDPYTKEKIPFMAHFDVQVMAATTLHNGNVAEMKTGEGKTQVGPMAAYLNALSGNGVHVITVNDYLARRDSAWMGRIFNYLGMTVGCLDNTEPGSAERRDAYNCDITYGTNNEFGFDYLRDNMASDAESCVQRELNFAIIDEVDNILIDEARTPLIISGAATKSNEEYEELRPRVVRLDSAQDKLISKVLKDVERLLESGEDDYDLGKKILLLKHGAPKSKRLNELLKQQGINKIINTVEAEYLREKKLHELDEDLYFTIDESGHSAELTEKGRKLISGDDPEFFVVPDLASEIGKIDADDSLSNIEKSEAKEAAHRAYADRSERIHSISQLLRAFSLFEKDVDYVVQDGQILIVDEFTGRILHGRRYSEGLHQALEAKEGVKVAGESQTLATITFQNFFKMYNKVAGMTGTAITEASEFHDIYGLDVVQIPTNRPLARKDYEDEIYRTQREKYDAVVDDIKNAVEAGRPVLVGTTSIEKSEYLGKLLTRSGIQHNVLNAKQHEKEAGIVAQAGRAGAVTIATNMAGRGTDIVLGGNFDFLAKEKEILQGNDVKQFSKEELRERHGELFKELTEEHEEVLSAGGLHIIGTERHESRRIDNQLRGRAGRQGDPGSSKFFLSLDDDLMRIFGSERIAGIMDRLGAEEGEVISHPLVSRSIGGAQKRVEGRNFEIRKHLKEYDDVMNLQRGEIYGLRERFLKGEDVKKEILEQMEIFIEESVFKYADGNYTDSWDLNGLYNDLQTVCGVTYRVDENRLSDITQERLFDEIMESVKKRYDEKEERFGSEAMRHFERGVFLMVLDNLWKDHLYEMDHLKEGVRFRAYGQKNPLYEYQNEGLKMFNELKNTLAKSVTEYLFRLEAVERKDVMGAQNSRLEHDEFDLFSQGGASQNGPSMTQANPATINTNRGRGGPSKPQPVRVEEKVGRNDPCPCGSGKKFKKCHGK